MELRWRNPRHWRSPKNQTLNNAFPDWDSGAGIISYLSDSEVPTPWEDVSAVGLDIAYHGQRSGDKFIAGFMYKYLDEDTAEITSSGISKIVSAIQARYYQKWQHLWSVYTSEYSPLDTYTLTESIERSQTTEDEFTNTRTPSLTTTDTISESTTRDGSNSQETEHGHIITTEAGGTTTVADSRFGFNSSDAVGTDVSVTTPDTENTETNSGTDTVSTTIDEEGSRTGNNSSVLTGSDENEHIGSETIGEEISKTRTGNIYRSPAELLKLDREFWLTDYFDIIFNDLDQMLTLAIYSESSVNTTIY